MESGYASNVKLTKAAKKNNNRKKNRHQKQDEKTRSTSTLISTATLNPIPLTSNPPNESNSSGVSPIPPVSLVAGQETSKF